MGIGMKAGWKSSFFQLGKEFKNLWSSLYKLSEVLKDSDMKQKYIYEAKIWLFSLEAIAKHVIRKRFIELV